MTSYLLLAPAFIERLREDAEFFQEHFHTLYADGSRSSKPMPLRSGASENRSIKSRWLRPSPSRLGYSWDFSCPSFGGGNILE